jgi:6-phosphofructokinase 1
VLGHVQRGGTPVPEDRVLGTQFGHAAVKLLGENNANRLVVMQGRQVADIDILHAENKQRKIEPDNELMAAAKAIGTHFGD